MQLTLSLVDVNPGQLADMFEGKIAQRLINHLYVECALDKDGISRVLPLLRRAFVSCAKAVTCEAKLAPYTVQADGKIAEVSAADQQATQELVNEMALLTAQVLDENRLELLLSLATVMAEQDEKWVKRTRH
ncbi:hypothetical protein [Pseudomonas serbica]|jgi:hypothetical protein|uniref:hypothetical protein n=1 Tax=Pseudomonas serbica TaxID=2965074 RepID=UPI00237BC666|nr:hypothetical protein [Pseudomonas serbica]